MIVHVSSLEREGRRVCSTMLSQVVVTPRSDALSTSTVGYIQRVFMRLHHYPSIHQSSYHHHEFLCAEGELEGDVSACSGVVRQLALSVHTLEHVVLPQSDADQPAP